MKKYIRAHCYALLSSALLSASALADDYGAARSVADEALAQANAIHQLATGTNNCYSAYAVSQAYYNANYYNAQIEQSVRQSARNTERICRYLEGKR